MVRIPGISPEEVVGVDRFASEFVYQQGNLPAMIKGMPNELNNLSLGSPAIPISVASVKFKVPIEIGWIAFYVLWGMAALHPSMRVMSEPTPEVESKLTKTRLTLLACVSLIAPTLMAWSASSDAGTWH